MSPASKSKSKDKRATVKDPQKSSSKPTANVNTVGGVTASGYNPLLGTFHTLETAPVSSAPPVHANGRSRSADDTDEHNSVGVGIEYDSVSNNGSWSGESEDHKDKATQGASRQEAIPGVDSDKREKIRQKNEKKHQRQKERRAQELHERCSGYLMSRKLEALAQQLVAMGFSSERATMALILNEGRVEESVAWLFEGGEDADNQREHNIDSGGNLKIDISEELAQIADMEIKFKCSKQEVERAVVACEGDLAQAAETLKVQKQEPPAAPPKPEETGDTPALGGSSKIPVPVGQNSSNARVQSKHSSSAGSLPIQQKTDERDFNYTKMAVTVGPTSAEPGTKNMQLLKKIQPNSEWTKQQQAAPPSAEKKWAAGGSTPSVSYSSSPSLQAAAPPQSKTDSRFANLGNELKNLRLGSVREPVIMMQRPQSKHRPITSISSSSSLASHVADWHPNGVEPVVTMNLNGFAHNTTSTRTFSTSSYGSSGNTQLYDQFHYQPQPLQQPLPPPPQHYVSSSGPLDHHFSQPGAMNHLGSNGMWSRQVGATSPTLAAASSLGLFSGSGSNGASGPSSPVDWNGGDSLQFDYTNIDWSLDRFPPPPSSLSRPNGGVWMSLGSSSSAMRPPAAMLSNGQNGHSMGGMALHPDGVGGVIAAASEASGGSGSRDWTSPFEEKDLFSFPRQFVSSPSL